MTQQTRRPITLRETIVQPGDILGARHQRVGRGQVSRIAVKTQVHEDDTPVRSQLDETTLPAGAVQTAGADPTVTTVVAGQSTDAGDDGYQLQGILSGHIYEDTDGSGVQNGAEPDLAGVDVVVTDSQGGVVTVTTDANGDWTASALPVGTATVDIDDSTLPVGLSQTEGADPNDVTVVADTDTDGGTDGYDPS